MPDTGADIHVATHILDCLPQCARRLSFTNGSAQPGKPKPTRRFPRARRIEREIAKRLGPDAVLESRTADPIEKLLAERKNAPREPIADREQEELQRQPEVQEFLREQGERHWENWLDTRLPALGNRTPRQAAGTPEGRERLEALFAEFAWMSERAENPISPDLTALRAKLGLP